MDVKQLFKQIHDHNEENGIRSQFSDPNPLHCVIVFSNDSWPTRQQDYSLESRSYEFTSDNKYFLPDMGGNSIFADSLDGSDCGVRLERYLGSWKVEDCYIKQ